jgi:hypothetical protein
MLLGYASGPRRADRPGTASSPTRGRRPGAPPGRRLAALLDAWRLVAAQPASPPRPTAWAERLRAAAGDLCSATDDSRPPDPGRLDDALRAWLDACDTAALTTPCRWPWRARPGWNALDEPALNQRFRAGGVTFCTCMPMRAIPFEVVCLLGMNDGDYPRRAAQRLRPDGPARPGAPRRPLAPRRRPPAHARSPAVGAPRALPQLDRPQRARQQRAAALGAGVAAARLPGRRLGGEVLAPSAPPSTRCSPSAAATSRRLAAVLASTQAGASNAQDLPGQLAAQVAAQTTRARRSGLLPMAELGRRAEEELAQTLQPMLACWPSCRRCTRTPLPKEPLRLDAGRRACARLVVGFAVRAGNLRVVHRDATQRPHVASARKQSVVVDTAWSRPGCACWWPAPAACPWWAWWWGATRPVSLQPLAAGRRCGAAA